MISTCYVSVWKEGKMEVTKFEDLGLSPEILRAIEEMGFEEATPIQYQAIPLMLEGEDIIGQAQTGTGKTAAFGIPLLMKVDPEERNTQAIVLCPTRELAIQCAEEVRKLAKYLHGIKVLPVYGGQDITRQIKALKGGATIIIGTPGRVMDHLRRKTIRLDSVDTIVLDEADEMLNMGFREDIETILSYMPNNQRQTVLFSATMPKPILDITKEYQTNAVTIKITKKELTVPSIDQYYYDIRRNDKIDVLCRLLDFYNPKLSLVFCNTKKMVDELAAELNGRGYAAEAIHGDMKQMQRDWVMKSFRTGRTDILIATDVAARGIDVDDVEAVFNYDLPQDNEYYVHRIGRTGRAGRCGRAFTFVKGKEVYRLKEIQRYCKATILAQPIPSSHDVAQIKAEKIIETIGSIIDDGNLSDMIEIIDHVVNTTDYTATDIAAAFLKQAVGGVELTKEDHGAVDLLSEDTGAEEGMVRLFINIGKKDKVRPGDILGAVAGESKIPGKLVGAIDMYDAYTFVEVPKEHGLEVLNAMKNAKIKGKAINIEPANRK
jgi:ATP-dependent RNA helicase DeaD